MFVERMARLVSPEQIQAINTAATTAAQEAGVGDTFHVLPVKKIVVPVLSPHDFRYLVNRLTSSDLGELPNILTSTEDNPPAKIKLEGYRFYELDPASLRSRDGMFLRDIATSGIEDTTGIDNLAVRYRFRRGQIHIPPRLADLVGRYGVPIESQPFGNLFDVAWVSPELDQNRDAKHKKAKEFVARLRKLVGMVELSPVAVTKD